MLRNIFTLIFSGVLCAAAAPAFSQDLTPPVVALTAPVHNAYLNSLPGITGTAFDNVVVSSVQVSVRRQVDDYYWDGSAFAAAAVWLEVPILSTSPVSWTYSTVPAWLNGAAYEITARAMDGSGNWSVDYSTSVFYYDTGVPFSRVVSPVPGSTVSSFTAISGTALDNEAAAAQVWVRIGRAGDNYYWNGALSQWTVAESWNLAVGSFTWTYTGLAAGNLTAGTTYTAVSRAADLAGNVEVSTDSAAPFLYAGPYVPPAGCSYALTVNNAGTGDHTSIQDAVDALPASLSGDVCVVVKPDGSYNEEVTVQGFTNNGYRIKIMAEPGGAKVTVSPQAGATAGFLLFNSSVTIENMEVIPAAVMPYGVLASSDNIVLSSVTVVSAGSISSAGIYLASYCGVYDSVVVVEDADGIRVTGDYNMVSRSSATNAGTLTNALSLDGGDHNRVENGGFVNSDGRTFMIKNGASGNIVQGNVIISEMSSLQALYFSGVSSNTIDGNHITNTAGGPVAAFVGNSVFNTISRSTVTTGGGGYGISFNNSDFNTVSESYVASLNGSAIEIINGSNDITVDLSHVTVASATFGAIFLNGDSNTVDRSFVDGGSGRALYFYTYADNNTVTRSTITGGSGDLPVLYFATSSSNILADDYIYSLSGRGVLIDNRSNGNTITRSTITVDSSRPALSVVYSGNLSVGDSYIRGLSTAVYVSGSTGTVIGSSVLEASSGPAVALFCRTSVGLSLSSASLSGGPGGVGLHLDSYNSGTLAISSGSLYGGAYGMVVSQQSSEAVLHVSGVSFRSLTAGTTAVNFLGGILVSTFSSVGFEGAVPMVNVNAAALGAGSRLTMRDASGPAYGTRYENDPSGYVDWIPDYIPSMLSSAAFSGVGISSLTVNWGSNFEPGTNYFVRLATHAAAAPYIAMATTTAASYGFTGLNPDAAYYGFVSTDIASGYIASGGGRTLAAAPSSAAFAGIAYSSAALTWSGGSNPAHTVYEFQVHTSSAFASFTSSGSLAATFAWSGGLAQGTTYFARVRAVNAAGTPTAYAYSGPAVTGVIYPAGVPSAVAGVTLGVSSISWTWTAGTLSAADRFVARAGGVILSTLPFAATGAHIQETLTPNTSHTLRVTGANAFGESTAAASAIIYTLAAQPAALAAPFVAPSSAALTWGLNGNAAGTISQLWRSPNDASYTNVYEGAALSHVEAGLEECTVYYYKARNVNGAGVHTAFTAPLSFTTAASTPAAPGGLYAEALDGARIALSWGHSPSTVLVTQYRLYYDNATGTIDYGVPYTIFSSTVSSWTTPALAAGNTYKFAVRALSRCGVEEANASAAYAQAVGVLSGVRAAIKVPQTGKRIKGNSVTVIAELTLGLPSQVKNVRFQYRLAGNIAWTDIAAANINHPNPDTAAPYFVHWDADAMAAGTYELRALATDIFNAADPAPPIVTVVVDPVDYDTSESVLGGQVRKEQKIANTVASTVQAGDDATALLSKVVIPAGAVNVATVSVTLIPNPPARPAPPAGSGDLAIAVKINLSNGQSQLAGGNSAVITLSYKDDDGDGVVDGTTAEVGRLRIYAASDAGSAWTPLASTVDRARKTVSAQTTHFSFFSAFATPASGLSSLKAYPNPWQPGAGGRFDAAAVTFGGLPNEARIKIFTILGELVRQLDVTAADAGTRTWDGRNSNGSKAASGVYLVRVESGSGDRTIKLAVER